jgi:surfeit locus 1 family protein
MAPGIAVAVSLSILIGLGVWQLHRKVWKEDLIAALQERLSKPPEPLPPPGRWSGMTQAKDEFRHVVFNATFLNDQETYVFGPGSAFRPDASGPGYWVFTPALLESGRMVVVERGFVPDGRKDPASRAAGLVTGPVRIVGALRWPDQPTWLTPAPDVPASLWFLRNQLSMAAARGWGHVAPFYVAQEGPVPPGGLPKPGPLVPALRDEHLQYALTWFALAAGLIAVFGFWAYGRITRSA